MGHTNRNHLCQQTAACMRTCQVTIVLKDKIEAVFGSRCDLLVYVYSPALQLSVTGA